MASHCTVCGELIPPTGRGGRPRTTHYPSCPVPAPPLPPPADPFNSTPVTAPLAPAAIEPSAVHDPDNPGPIETQLAGELATVVTTNPLAGTLGAVALRCARAADLAPPTDLKAVLAAVKELRAIMAEITKSHAGGGDDDGIDDTPFGASRPEVVHAPPV